MAGLEVPSYGAKRPIRCPFHDDKHASAFLSASNVFACSVCSPGHGYSAKTFAERLRVQWRPKDSAWERFDPASPAAPTERPAPSFTPTDAAYIWELALARARDDTAVRKDRDAYNYLIGRGIAQALESDTVGVLAESMPLPSSVRWWPGLGYRIVAPLFDLRGELANVQARAIVERERKTMFPDGSTAKGTVFASSTGLEVLRNNWEGSKCVILGEGLTDYLGLSIASSIPVLSAPGSAMSRSAIGPWVRGFRVFLAHDWDEAGEAAIRITLPCIREHGGAVTRLDWPGGVKDACDVIKQRGVEGLRAFLGSQVDGR